MFKFLKRLFFEVEEKEVSSGEEIKVDELENWFKGKADKILSELNIKIKGIKGKIGEEKAKAKEHLAVLSAAKLHNPKITVKEIQFMEGNRKAYILAVNNFLRGVELEEEDYSKLLGFCDNFNERLEKFGKSTVRSYNILQEFFSHESKNIAINIRNLDGSVKELAKAVNEAKISNIEKIKNRIIDLKNKIKQKDDFENLSKDKEGIKEGLIKNKGELEKELDELVKGEGYKKLQELKAEKEAVLASIREHNAKVVHAFSVMERPMKKLVRVVIEDGDLLEKYIEKPVETLVNDGSLKIVGLLKKLEQNINNLTLELKDKKREKVLETIKGLTEEFLREFVHKHDELNNKLEDLEEEINEDEVLRKENKLNFELGNVMDNLEKVSSEILNNEQELSKINIEEMKNSLGNEVNELLNVDVVIS